MERTISFNEIGKCPYCSNTEYERISLELFDDAVFVKCDCKCGNSFEETFRLLVQHWDRKYAKCPECKKRIVVNPFFFKERLCKECYGFLLEIHR